MVLKVFGNLWKCSEITGKFAVCVIGTVWKDLQESNMSELFFKRSPQKDASMTVADMLVMIGK